MEHKIEDTITMVKVMDIIQDEYGNQTKEEWKDE